MRCIKESFASSNVFPAYKIMSRKLDKWLVQRKTSEIHAREIKVDLSMRLDLIDFEKLT